MSDAHRVIIGPITRREARKQRIKYGPLTASQYDDLERIDMLGTATLLDLANARRSEDSVARAMYRLVQRGWVDATVDGEAWRLTDRGSLVLGFASEHLDTMAMELEGDCDA